MSLPVAYLNHLCVGTCCAHRRPTCIPSTGNISVGAFSVLTEGQPTARIGDLVVLACGHTALIISGSPTVIAEGIPVARTSDSVGGVFIGNVVGGAATVTAQ